MQTRDYEPWFLWHFCILLFQAPVPVRDYFTKECFLEGVVHYFQICDKIFLSSISSNPNYDDYSGASFPESTREE
jgi:hypothetical protein